MNNAWNKENTAAVVAAYDAGNGDSVEAIAKETGRTVASVRSKLVAEGVYVKPEKAATNSAGKTRKVEYVNALKALTGLNGLDSLEKANLGDLEALTQFLINSAK